MNSFESLVWKLFEGKSLLPRCSFLPKIISEIICNQTILKFLNGNNHGTYVPTTYRANINCRYYCSYFSYNYVI